MEQSRIVVFVQDEQILSVSVSHTEDQVIQELTNWATSRYQVGKDAVRIVQVQTASLRN